jgi:hypothetical protein
MSANEIPSPQPVYLYGVVRAGGTLAFDEAGVGGRPLELVEHDGVAAVVSDFPADDDFRVRRSDLHAHLRSVERIFEQATVAPCPFGTVIGSREQVEWDFLGPRRDELQTLLERLEGHVQMNVKAEYDEQTVLADLVADDPEIGRLRERTKALGTAAYYENIRLGELIASRLAARREAAAAEIEAVLAAAAAAAVSEPAGAGGLLVFKGSFLVAREALAEFDRALEALAAGRAPQLRFEATGPLPPIAFATLEPEAAAWA